MLKVLGAVVVGLIATLFVYYLIGAALFGQRPSWSVGQGEGFRVFLVSGGAAPFGGLYWGVVAARFQVRQAGSRAWWIALAICLLAGVAVHLALDPGP